MAAGIRRERVNSNSQTFGGSQRPLKFEGFWQIPRVIHHYSDQESQVVDFLFLVKVSESSL